MAAQLLNRRYETLTNTLRRAFLWGFTEADGATSGPVCSDRRCYIYRPGDGCDVIEAGYDLLWLQQIQLSEVMVSRTCHGKLQVSYQGQPILRMQGIELIRTEDGCFSVDHWLGLLPY